MGGRGAGVSGEYSLAEQQKAIVEFSGVCTNGNQQICKSDFSITRGKGGAFSNSPLLITQHSNSPCVACIPSQTLLLKEMNHSHSSS